jgi:flagellar hook-length control protein FliK
VFSVTSETAANLSLQNAPSRSARADQSPAPGSFSALIDSNAAPVGNDRATAPDRMSPQQRSDEPFAASDSRQPRDNASSSVAAASTSSQDAQPGAGRTVAADASADAGTAIKPAKQGFAKSGIVKAAVKDPASDITVATDSATSADPVASPQPAASTAVTPAPVAVAIAVAVAATAVVAAPVSNGNATEPLAIATAAIATSTSTVEVSKPAVAPAQVPIDLATNAPASPTPAVAAAPTAPVATPATASTNTPDPTAAASNTARPAVSDIVVAPVDQPAAKADPVMRVDPEFAAAVAVATPVAAVAPKAAPKIPIAVRPSESAAPIKTGVASEVADLPAAPPSSAVIDKSVAPQGPAADGNRKPDGVAVDAAKTDPAGANAPAITVTASPHEHRATAAAQVQTEPSDAGQVANAVPQSHAQPATVPAAAQLSVTAATTAAVPLNGLALQIAVTAQSGKSRFEIRLDPAELGRIDVRIDVDRHGQVTSHLTVEKPETLAMLRQDAPQLQRALDNAGFKTGDSGLQFSLRDQSWSGQNPGDDAGRNAQRLIISEDDSVPAAVAGRTYGRVPGSGSGVDIRV